MQLDFHYYATYCAAFLAGYSHEESLSICTAAQFVDCCTKTAPHRSSAGLQLYPVSVSAGVGGL